MKQNLFSAPGEEYEKHIKLCMEKFDIVYPLFLGCLKRVLSSNDDRLLKDALLKMILYHDLGKLTKEWQENVGRNKPLPSHSTAGACYLWKVLPENLKEPISFAVAIHHTDRGLLGDNIEKPDVQAILERIVDNSGNILWHKDAFKLNNDLFPENAKNLTVNDLKEMARGLRVWAKGCRLLEQHQRRLQASLAHHILKLCDISAAKEGRNEYQKKDEQDYYGGWLMADEIKKYVENKRALIGG